MPVFLVTSERVDWHVLWSALVSFDWPLVLVWERRGVRTVLSVCGLGLAETLCLPSECLLRLPGGLECAGGWVTSCVVQVLMFCLTAFADDQLGLRSAVGAAPLWFKFSSAEWPDKIKICCMWGAPLMSWLQEEVLPLTPALNLSQEHHWCRRCICSLADNTSLKKTSLTTSWPRHFHHRFALPHGCLAVVWISHCKVGGIRVGLSCF